ncbi:MAG: hypothetical protein AAF721_17545 [Myxococcota bacterium]
MRWSSLGVALLVGCGTTPAVGSDRDSEASTGGTGCRQWPYAADGGVGDACALHQDCEPGLVCGDP